MPTLGAETDLFPGKNALRKTPGKPAARKIRTFSVGHYIMSRKMSPEDFPKAVRSHWAIENRLHWVLDVQMREDDLRNRAGHGAVNLAAVRRLVVNLANLQDDKLSFRRRLLKAARVPEYCLEIIANAVKLAETF